MLGLLQKSPRAAAHTILCVDDEPQILEVLALTLGRQYHVELAASGMAALERLRSIPETAVIISDMRMPSMNGAQFLAAARKIAPNARRILLTGHANTSSAILAVNDGGIFRFLTKPCPFEILMEAVEAAIDDYEEDARERSAIRRAVAKDLLSHDLLTGLASRETLVQTLDACIGPAGGEWRAEVVFVIEVSDVEELSGGYDSKTADQLLRSLAAELQHALPAARCIARYREATFAALISPEDSSDAALESLALQIVSALERPIDLDSIAVQSRATVGIARIPAGTHDPRCALRYAESAALEAKRQGGDPVRLFSRESIVRNERRREIVQALRLAVSQQQFTLDYQPIIDIERNQVYSIEALARWHHEHLGSISPGIFIPLAEESGLMTPLGAWVMNRACADARRLCGSLFPRVSVNVSIAQLLDSRFMWRLQQAIDTTGIDPTALELEVTESVFADDIDRICRLLTEVRRLGVTVAIDDFGAGYSSLTYLSRLPVDVLKIDGTFVRQFDHGGEAIIAAAISVARKREIQVIVEGVETALDLEHVRALGADKVQGFHFARPMPASGLLDWHEQFNVRKGAA